ncbi:MAG: hypothetical protein R3F19_25730 [Verrucomicrobiales bacterium]|nr:hypothetical protein [Verrucomicrobiae bacterium]
MKNEEKNLRTAAKWMFKERHPGYWTFPVLLGNTVSTEVKNLNLSADDASMVFDVLDDLELLKEIEGEKKEIDGIEYQKYRINYAKLHEFYEFCNPPFYYKVLPDEWIFRVRQLSTLLIVCTTVILTTVAQSWVKTWFTDSSKARDCIYLKSSPEKLSSIDLDAFPGMCIHIQILDDKKTEPDASLNADKSRE